MASTATQNKPLAILSDPWPVRTRVRLKCRDCAKSGLHGTITGFPTKGMAELVWDEIWEGKVLEIQTESKMVPTYTIDHPEDRLPLSRLDRLPIQTMRIQDFVEHHGTSLEGFGAEICYCGRRNMNRKYSAIAGSESPLANPFKVEDCKVALQAMGKAATDEAALRLACNRYNELLRITLAIHLNKTLEWRGQKISISTENEISLSSKQVEELLKQDYPRGSFSPETVDVRRGEYDRAMRKAVQDCHQGYFNLHLQRVHHEAVWRELQRLAKVVKSGKRLVLLCWREGHCHTYGIGRAVEYLAGKADGTK